MMFKKVSQVEQISCGLTLALAMHAILCKILTPIIRRSSSTRYVCPNLPLAIGEIINVPVMALGFNKV
jgi:hypothetical protein